LGKIWAIKSKKYLESSYLSLLSLRFKAAPLMRRRFELSTVPNFVVAEMLMW